MSWYKQSRNTLRVDSIVGKDGAIDIGVANKPQAIRVASTGVGVLAGVNPNAALAVGGNLVVAGVVQAGYGRAGTGPLLLGPDGTGIGQFDGFKTRMYSPARADAAIMFSTVGSTPDAYTDILTVATDTRRVGVGATAPQAALHVVGDMIVEGRIQSSSGVAPPLGSSPFNFMGKQSGVQTTVARDVAMTPPIRLDFPDIFGEQFSGGVFGPESGNVYFVPASAKTVLALNTRTGTVSQIGTVVLDNPLYGEAYRGGTLGADGKVYCTPFFNANVLIIDTVAGTVSTSKSQITNVASSVLDRYKFRGAVVSPVNGNVYFVPFSANAVVRYDPVADAVTKLGGDLQQTRWCGGALGGDGKVYCPPHNSGNVLVVDTATDVLSYIDVPVKWYEKSELYAGAVTGPDGKVYCVPYSAESVLCIDPFARTSFQFGNVGTMTSKWDGGSLGPDGKVYCAPLKAGNVLVVDTVTKSVSFFGDGTFRGNCFGTVLAPAPTLNAWATYAIPKVITDDGTPNPSTTPFSTDVIVQSVSHGVVTVPKWLTSPFMNRGG